MSDQEEGADLQDVEVSSPAGGEEEQLIPSNTGGDKSAAKLRSKRTPGKTASATKKKKASSKSSSNKEDDDSTSKAIKYAALLLLVAQMVGLVLLMRYSRTLPREPGQPLYLASTAVFIMEMMKFLICCVVIAYQSGGDLIGELNRHVIESPMEVAKLCVPSLLYCVQNNLLYFALTNLDAATYQVCYQLKILTTALFSAVLLQRTFSARKWISLVILTIGVAIVQISGSGDHHKEDDAEKAQHNRFIGLVAVLCAACTSGFSGVYFEKILKGSTTSLWLRNVQMGLPSILIALITVYAKDAKAIAEHGFLGGYSPIVWTVVTVQAAGGLIVAVVVKYADNVLKVFATSFSIVVSCIITAVLFDFRPSFRFVVGATLVVVATVMYSAPEKKRKRKPLLPTTQKINKY
ncbi:UDP-galactose translocator [Seminavis robusta]|uniref:UDP-galactose translocator n=1 Tax=Seminavis robusta TaxID=568900 RepID=A0A9N8HP15_9STRA|nr:UDP-galactose translocator [Seminavis robusta]|eukprot:Sro1029_g233260.1 UDP-galactose translocator (407) ;mRNA; f:12615-14083